MRSPLLLMSLAAVLAGCLDTRGRDSPSHGPAKPFSLPAHDDDPKARAARIQSKREGILYGHGPDQNITAYPAGPLGDTIWQTDTASLVAEQDRHGVLVEKDVEILSATGGIQSLADYSKLYDQQWKNSIGNVVDLGSSANYTNDLFFSMQRLTVNPLVVRRLKPHQRRLPFRVDDAVARKVSGMTAEQLLRQGRLFYVDHRALSKLPRQEGRFSAACEAYFYISARDGKWLPLAIKTNEGADLVYTPADAPVDWLFAKILFGQNDVWDTPWRHFASTHLVVELPYMAAQRCMGDGHPVLAIYKKLMLNAFGIRQFIQSKLCARGQFIDQVYAFDGRTAVKYAMDLYEKGEKNFRANCMLLRTSLGYNSPPVPFRSVGVVSAKANDFMNLPDFPRRLERNGLLNSKFGPPIRHFPFAEDAARIQAVWKSFMGTLVHSYYDGPSSIRQDQELACWFKEVRRAGSADFPGDENISAPELIDVLAHVAYLNSVQHQAMNNNDQFINAQVPLSPMTLYKPLPTKKGLSEGELLSLLPNVTQILKQLSLAAAFSRAEFVDSERALIKVFSDGDLHSSLNSETKAAAARFEADMEKLSAEIAARGFDKDGLCNGAPFIWRSLDPRVALYSTTI
ncbi:hypothetical protein EsDP_00005500 [Epichloe bromicola]|uniref:Manganese lipoxygenase n=1 Tax=Epichloe bromicola TaxID=79588 RepID=A0ABQ0CUW0_9HYPO